MLWVPSTRTLVKELSPSQKALFVWADRTYDQKMLFGKQPKDVPERAGTSQDLSPIKLAGAVAAAVQPTAAVIQGVLGNKEVDMMMDSGSSVSLIEHSVAVGFLSNQM